MKSRTVSLFVLGILLALLLTACSSASPASQPPEATPIAQPQAGSHPPVILRVVEREEVIDGFQYDSFDIYFTDPDGDAVAVTYREVASSLSYPIPLSNDLIEASIEEQKGEAVFTAWGRCPFRIELALEIRIQDRGGNLSEPMTLPISCTTPPVVDTRSFLINVLSLAIPFALILGLGFWLLFRKSPAESLPAFRSTLLLFCLLLLSIFGQLTLHEGGHCLYPVSRGIPFTLYVHPFLMPGYCRPAIDNIWKDILGSMISLPLAALISLPFWKRRSPALLPLGMLFSYVAIADGINVSGLIGGDFMNLVQGNGVSPIPFILLGALIFVVGIVSLFAILPLLGLDPKENNALFVLPAAMFLVGILSFPVTCILVPGSPIDQEYFLGHEIVTQAIVFLAGMTILWAILAVLYVTLWRRVYPRLPAWLRTETVALNWKDLRLPALLAAISVILGLIIII